MSNTTLVIGGSGFVGSFLISELNLNQTLNFDKVESPFYNTITTLGNVLDKGALNNVFKNNPSINSVVLLAAEHRDDVSPTSLYYDVNVKGAQHVLEAMDAYGVKNLVFTSSVAVYGLNKTNPDESHPVDPFNHYGKSKWQAEEVINSWYHNNPQNKSVTILRPTVIFGERNRGNVYNLLKQIATGKFMMIGGGTNKKSMAYVKNVTAFIKQMLTTTPSGYEVYNYVDTPDFTMNELLQTVKTTMNLSLSNIKIPYWLGMLGGYGFDALAFATRKKRTVSAVRVKKFCATTQFNATKAHAVYKAPFTLAEGLNNTLKHEFLNPQNDDILFYSE